MKHTKIHTIKCLIQNQGFIRENERLISASLAFKYLKIFLATRGTWKLNRSRTTIKWTSPQETQQRNGWEFVKFERYSTTRKWQTENYSYCLKRRNIIRLTLLPFGSQLAMDVKQKRTTIMKFLWLAKLIVLLDCYCHWLKKIDTNVNRTYQLKLLNNNERMSILRYLRKKLHD